MKAEEIKKIAEEYAEARLKDYHANGCSVAFVRILLTQAYIQGYADRITNEITATYESKDKEED